MTNTKLNGTKFNGSLVFIQEFLKHPFQIGSIIPGSRFLERRIVRAAEVASSDVIIELGPGTGGVTRAILHAMPPLDNLLSVKSGELPFSDSSHTWAARVISEKLFRHMD